MMDVFGSRRRGTRPRSFAFAPAKILAATLAATLTFAAPGLAQHATLSGRVTSAGDVPISEARVGIVGTTLVALTNAEGRYSIRNVPAGNVEVRVFRIGFLEQKKPLAIPATGTPSLDFLMVTSVVNLNEFVVTATGIQRKAEIGNSVSSINAAALVPDKPIHNMADLLVAKAPGLSVLPGNMSGSGAQIRIRGLNSVSRSNAPIYVIDGVRMEGGSGGFGVGGTNSSRLNDLSPEEIEDIQVIKGPAAATLYGTNAANGVISIKTKSGRRGATKYAFSMERGVITDPNKYWDTYAIWGHTPTNPTVQTRCLLTTMASGACIKDSVTSANMMRTDGVSPIHQGERSLYGLQISGGSDAVRFFVSGNLEGETGPLKMPGIDRSYLQSNKVSLRDEWTTPEKLRRTSIRANLNATLSPKLDILVNSSFIKSDQRLPQVDNNVNSFYYNAYTNPGFIKPYTCTSPCSGLGYSGIGNLGQPLSGWAQYTPGDIFQFTTLEGVQRMLGSVQTNWRPFTWLANSATTGVDLTSYNNFRLCRLNECPNFGTQRQGSIGDVHGSQRVFTANARSEATWAPRTWFNVKATIGADYINDEAENSNANATQLSPGGQTVGSGAVKGASNQQPTATKTLGYFGQALFSYQDRLFITTAIRNDQNTAFGTQYKSVTYPSAQVAWVISESDFFPKAAFLDEFRLRTAYGSSGVQPGSTSALRTFSASTVSLTTDQTALLSSAIGNPNLKPETTTEYEAGFDSRWLADKVSLEFTYYHKQSKDALINQNIATSAGAPVGSVLRNLGAVRNQGVEVSLQAQLLDIKALGGIGWDINVGASRNRNKLVTLGLDDAGKPIPTIGTTTRQQEGYPLNSFFVQSYTYNDTDKNGLISVNEVTLGDTGVYVGSALPTDMVTLQSGFDLIKRKLRIISSFDYRGGFTLFNSGANFLCGNTNTCKAKSDPTSSLFEQARQVAANLSNPKTTYGYYENGEAVRLREISAVLRMPKRVANLLRADEADFQFGARNLKVWTKYTGQDPEANYSTGDVQQDFLTTAPRKYYTVRLNLRY